MRDALKCALAAELRALVREDEDARQRDLALLDARAGSARRRVDDD